MNYASGSEEDCKVFIDEVDDPSLQSHVIISFTIIYCFQFVLGFFGNIMVILLTLKHRRLQTVQNLFMLNLALADLIVCIFSLPITPITNIYKNWYFGDFLCHSLPWIQGTSVFIATFTLAAIAIDRYCLIVRPHWKRLASRRAKYVMLALWIACALMTLPYSWYMKLDKIEGLCGTFCTEQWPDTGTRRSYTLFVLFMQFFVPFTIIFWCYFCIFAKLRERAHQKLKKLNERSLILLASTPIMSTMMQKIPEETELLSHCRKKGELLSQTRRNTLVLVSMVVVFGMSCFPHNAASVALEFTDGRVFMSSDGRDFSYLVSLVTHSISMMNNVANPILYGLLNPKFVEMIHKTCTTWKESIRKLKRLETVSSNTTFV